MKKILLIILCLSIPTYSYASGACLIKDSSSQVLLEYIKDNRKVIKNISKSLNIKGVNNKYKGELNKIVSMYNNLFTFLGYDSYFRYYVTLPLTNEVPFQIKRDYKILDYELQGLNNYLYKLNKNGNTNILIKKACQGVESKCELNNLTAGTILGKLIDNNLAILNLYRLSVLGESNNFKKESSLILVKNNFLLEIEKNYGQNAINSCNISEGSFGKRINIAISDIKLANKKGVEGKEKWKNAWNLLVGNSDYEEKEKEKEDEKKQLYNYLSLEGISTSNRDITLKNLDTTNNEGLSINNNFVTNSVKSIYSKITKQTTEWAKNNVIDFFKNTKNNENQDNISIIQLQNIEKNSKATKIIEQSISSLYEKEIPFTVISNITTEKLRAKIIQTHIELDDSIKILEKTILNSQKICNYQGGGGKCN